MSATLPEPLASAGFSPEQKEYLTGLFAGLAARGQRFSDVEPPPAPKNDELIFEERVKRELHPLDAYQQIVENALANKAPDKEDLFRFKWNGLFFLTPVKDAFMARLRIPGGVVKTYQLRELARIAQELTTGYVQLTTRANLQMRLIQPKDAPEVLRRIQSVGLHTRGAGADNIRNLTMNPTAGVDPVELIDVQPFVQDLAQIIINDRSFYNLPRKFNIAFDGGGLIGSVEDTNDIGVKAVRLGDEILFRVALGGATGHQSFARDLGVVVPPVEITKVVAAIVRVFIERGCRTDRKKARLKHLLEKVPLDEYLAEVEKKLGQKLRRALFDPAGVRWASQELPHSHVGDFPQKQKGLKYVGATCPVGQITPKQMLRLADLADSYGSGEIRLTVWQNFIVPNVSDAFVPTLKRALEKAGFMTNQSNLASGVVACTGNSYCKFAQSNTKGHALQLIKQLEKRLELDQPVNIHLTGCPNSCAQHYMGDIGCLGVKTRLAGESVDGYHVFVGGGFGKNQAVGRQVFSGVTADELPRTIERMLRAYLRHRQAHETFQQFTRRHDLGALQVLFGE
ncbi:MAG TPA: NirA family protein [Candidatus Binatia bacterium]|jgi:ferredoxin-nitrite reductase|nr:NirA family protein [Candidatus Binatia bacterium]